MWLLLSVVVIMIQNLQFRTGALSPTVAALAPADQWQALLTCLSTLHLQACGFKCSGSRPRQREEWSRPPPEAW